MADNPDSSKASTHADPKVGAKRHTLEKIQKEIRGEPKEFCTLNTPAKFAWTVALSPAKICKIMNDKRKREMKILELGTEEKATGASVGIFGEIEEQEEVTKDDGGKAEVGDDKTAGEELVTADSAGVDQGNNNGEEDDGSA